MATKDLGSSAHQPVDWAPVGDARKAEQAPQGLGRQHACGILLSYGTEMPPPPPPGPTSARKAVEVTLCIS